MAGITYRALAERLKTTKQTIYNYVNELDPNGVHVNKTSTPHEIDSYLAGLIADKMMSRKPYSMKLPGIEAQEAAVAEKRIEVAQSEANGWSVLAQKLQDDIEHMRAEHEKALKAKDDEASQRLADLEVAKDKEIRRIIAMKDAEAARIIAMKDAQIARLEAFNNELQSSPWPWQKRSVVKKWTQLLLEAPKAAAPAAAAPEATYETPGEAE